MEDKYSLCEALFFWGPEHLRAELTTQYNYKWQLLNITIRGTQFPSQERTFKHILKRGWLFPLSFHVVRLQQLQGCFPGGTGRVYNREEGRSP